MKRFSTKRLVALGVVLCLALLAVVIFPGFVAAVFGPPLDRAKAHRVLAAAATPEELRKAVGLLGALILLGDGSWIAVRYTDSHAYPGYSCAVALDSDGQWFSSTRHFCGRFSSYEQNKKRAQDLRAALGHDEEAMQKALHAQDEELYNLATAATLDEARTKLLRMGFSK
jgi:hypothetical protein